MELKKYFDHKTFVRLTYGLPVFKKKEEEKAQTSAAARLNDTKADCEKCRKESGRKKEELIKLKARETIESSLLLAYF